MLQDIGGVLESRAQKHGDRALFCFYDGDGAVSASYTYGSFLEHANFVADALRGLGITPGEPVLLAYPPGLDMAVALFAATMVGAVPVPTPPPHLGQPAGRMRLAHIAASAGARRVLSTSAIADRAAAGDNARLEWIATNRFDGRLGSFRRTVCDTLLVQFTSGSTSAPRGVVLSHANVIHNARLSLPRDPQIGVSWLPHFHDMGLLGYYIHCVINGGASHLFSPSDFLRRPILWFDLISRMRATMTTAPNGAYDYCLREDKLDAARMEGLDLSSLRLMVNCAEPVRPGTLERFWRRFAPCGLKRSAMVSAFGLAEHTLCVTMGGSRIAVRTGPEGETRRFVSCGRPAAGVDLRIVDAASRRALRPGQVGEIWVDSPSKAGGYWRAPDGGRATFQAAIAGDAGGRSYLRTGDLGFLDGGELFVCGRLRDMLIVNGRNVFPADIEAVLEERFASPLAGRVVAFGVERPDGDAENLVVLVENGAEAIGLAVLRDAIEAACSIPVSVIARVPRGAIVKTSSGKIARGACRRKWIDGEIGPIDVLRAGDGAATAIEATLARFAGIAAALGEGDATLDQLGLDSIALVNLSLSLEKLVVEQGAAADGWLEKAADMSLILSLRLSELTAAMKLFRAGQLSAVADMFDRLSERIRADEAGRMRVDAAMPLPQSYVAGSAGGEILLTGATGFLGAFVLRSLLERTGERVHVLVRGGGDPAEAARRVRRALLQADCRADVADEALRSRIDVLTGDVGEARFGLPAAAWRRLADRVGRIYHCAAEVDYVKSYALLRASNVAGAANVIALLAEGRAKTLHHVSTTFVFGWSNRPRLMESDNNAEMARLDFGYAQSKWVAEQLVLRARERGASATIYRPSLVTASAGRRFVRRDLAARTLGYMIRHGLTVDAENQVSFLPVDICADNIVALSARDGGPEPVFHMTADGFHTLAGICAIISRRFGYRFRAIPLPDFVAYAHANCGPDDDLYPLLSFFDRNTARILAMGGKRYDSRAYRSARDADPSAREHPSMESTVGWIVEYLRREKLIPEPPLDARPERLDPVGALT